MLTSLRVWLCQTTVEPWTSCILKPYRVKLMSCTLNLQKPNKNHVLTVSCGSVDLMEHVPKVSSPALFSHILFNYAQLIGVVQH